MEFESTKLLTKNCRWREIIGNLYDWDFYGDHEIIVVNAKTYYASMQEIEIICNKTEMVTINMYLGNHSSYDERYFSRCRYICDNMEIKLIRWDVVGWNERMVLLSDINWRYATKEILENYLEEMAKVAHQIRDKLKDYGYDTSLWI